MAERDKLEIAPSKISTSPEATVGQGRVARGYLAISSGTMTHEMVKHYIAEQEGEPLKGESQFVIDETAKLPPSRR